MKLRKVIDARRVLDSFSSQEGLGAHLAYWMTKFVVKTENEHIFYAKEMRKLIDAYSTHNANGATVIPTEQIENFYAAVDRLNNTDVEDPGIRFSLSELSTELKLSMQQMYLLLDFIEEEK